jgi:3-isopropylmalate/(R)-2-methylmalate dehydratase small subunit
MKAVRVHTGRAVPLTRSDVDTDQIIPSDWLKRVERTGFGRGLFSEWRDEPSFVLNDERYAGATVLVTGPNFGVGSSREHAVWALMDYGFEVVISPRFGDIFRNNSTKNGLVPVVLSDETVGQIHAALEEDPGLDIVVDVERLVVEVPSLGMLEPFELDAATQHRFLNGLDDIGITLGYEAEIEAYERQRPAWLPAVS